LAEQLLVNPNTVARAYRELEGAGVVTSRQGSGVFVAEGVSPLARRERTRILQERIDMLLTEARHMNVDVETVVSLLRQRSEAVS
jgi:GntR family transcriptional regulator